MSTYVLILGAGASRALHRSFEIGLQMVEGINNRVTDWNSSDKYLSAKLNSLGYDAQLRTQFEKHLKEYRTRVTNHSIDGFIDEVNVFPEYQQYRKQYTDIAKFLVVAHIMGYEGSLRHTLPLDCNWVDVIAKFLLEKNILGGSRTANLKIITFNYDRSLEHLLYNSPLVKGLETNVRDYITNNVFHVYGKIGALQWQDSSRYFDIGEDNDKELKILENIDAIQLIYEERWRDTKLQYDIENCILSPNNTCVATYGYGFDMINNGRLSLQKLHNVNRDCRFLVHMHNSNFAERNSYSNRVRAIQHDTEFLCTDGITFLNEFLYSKKRKQ